MKKTAKTGYTTFIFLLLMSIHKIESRSFRMISSDQMVLDGVDDQSNVQFNQSNYLLLPKEMKMENSSEEECEQLYGFLPCSKNIFGHLFLIAVYEYLLFHGESYASSGAGRIFKILGPGVFGASAFQVLGALPESLLLLASGLLNTKEVAQEYVYTGVGLLAGSSILLLTVLWGTCIILGSQKYSNISEDGSNKRKRLISTLTGYGINMDEETSYTARIMVISVIPFIIMQVPKIFPLSSEENIVIFIALSVSVLLLLLYFFYQMFQPWIQERRLEFVKHEHLIVNILEHVQKQALGRLLTEDGSPNVDAIRRLFEEIDQDGDDSISVSELKILLEIKFRKLHYYDKTKVIAEVMKQFDSDNDVKITKADFVNGFMKWLDETKHGVDRRYYSEKSLNNLYQVFQPWIQNKRKEHQTKKDLISEILGNVQSNSLGRLLTEEGTPDITNIRRLFENLDRDGDNCLSQPELKQLITNMKYGKIPLDADKAVEKIMEELDTSGDHKINEEEFVTGLANWLDASNYNQDPHSPPSQDDTNQKTWEETDMLVDSEKIKGVIVNEDKSPWEWLKAITHLVFGIVILGVLAEPLINSVQNFSKAANIPSFFFAFILVPLTINAREATSAIKAACRKKPRTTSLTFSEIYSGVFMNNVLGFSVLLCIIYVRGLTWEFSAEVLVVVIVCVMMGLIASFQFTFPVWTSIMAYLMYPLSLLLVYILNDILQYA